jgi:predicted cobalt transporter CbtA
VEKRIIARGLLAGAIAGVLAFVFARIFVEPVIGRAVGFEDGRGELPHSHGVHEHGAELFTRGVQANVGMGFGVLAFSVAMGALFAVAFAVAYRRVGALGPRMLSVSLAAAAFGNVYLVPFLKYPPNPPAVGHGETIRERTGLYLLMVALSVALAVAALLLGRRLSARMGGWGATLSAVGAYVVAIAVVMLVLPTVAETPGPMLNDTGAIVNPGFPADDLYDFRLYSLGTQLVLWATIGLVFAALAGRLLDGRASTGRAASIAS